MSASQPPMQPKRATIVVKQCAFVSSTGPAVTWPSSNTEASNTNPWYGPAGVAKTRTLLKFFVSLLALQPGQARNTTRFGSHARRRLRSPCTPLSSHAASLRAEIRPPIECRLAPRAPVVCLLHDRRVASTISNVGAALLGRSAWSFGKQNKERERERESEREAIVPR